MGDLKPHFGPESARDEYRDRGFLFRAIPLADPSIVPALLADEPLFSAELDRLRAEGRRTVPYLLTDAIRRAAQDPAIVGVVEAILGTREWVMWGANIRRATPNQAQAWHVDLESLRWPTVTVAVGLSGCTPNSATWCIAGTQRRAAAPPSTHEATVAHGKPEQIAGFADAHFYVFDARVWHRGDPATSRERVVLFVHYQRASERRIPLMLDYERQTFAKEAAPYFTTAPTERVCTNLADSTWRYRLGAWLRRLVRQ